MNALLTAKFLASREGGGLVHFENEENAENQTKKDYKIWRLDEYLVTFRQCFCRCVCYKALNSTDILLGAIVVYRNVEIVRGQRTELFNLLYFFAIHSKTYNKIFANSSKYLRFHKVIWSRTVNLQ